MNIAEWKKEKFYSSGCKNEATEKQGAKENQ